MLVVASQNNPLMSFSLFERALRKAKRFTIHFISTFELTIEVIYLQVNN